MKAATKREVEKCRRICLDSLSAFHVCVIATVQRMDAAFDADPEVGDDFKRLLGYRWQLFDDDGETIKIVSAFPGLEENHDEIAIVDAIEPSPRDLFYRFSSIPPSAVVTVVAEMLGAGRIEHLAEWIRAARPRLQNTLNTRQLPPHRRDWR